MPSIPEGRPSDQNEGSTKRRVPLIIPCLGVLLILGPLVAQMVYEEFLWRAMDFVVWTLLVGSTVSLLMLGARSHKKIDRLAVAVSVMTGFLTIWANLAVGIIGREDNPMNLLYFGFLAVGIVGAVISRGRSEGLVITLGMMSALHFGMALWLCAVLATPAALVTGILSALWCLAATLFHRASQGDHGHPQEATECL
jgi:hypothetical protein